MANWNEAIDDKLQWHDFANPVGMAAYMVQGAKNMFTGGQEASSAALLDDRKWAEEQAQKQMDFQKMMSDTAWQRGVADMKAAGLNPALAYMQGGASSSSGAQAGTSSTAQARFLQSERMMFGLANSALSLVEKAIPGTTFLRRRWG